MGSGAVGPWFRGGWGPGGGSGTLSTTLCVMARLSGRFGGGVDQRLSSIAVDAFALCRVAPVPLQAAANVRRALNTAATASRWVVLQAIRYSPALILWLAASPPLGGGLCRLRPEIRVH